MYYPQHKKTFSNFLNEVKNKKVAVIGHMRPDGDCIGSQVAFVQGLLSLKIDAIALNKDPAPKTLKSFLHNTPFAHKNFSNYKDYIPITVDCSDQSRFGEELNHIFPNIKLNIDHHISNQNYAQINIVEGKSAASCEIIAGLFLDQKISINPIAAQALYLGIATDTGQFCYNTTNAHIFSLCSKLVDLGAQPRSLSSHLYEQKSINQILLLKDFLSTLKFESKGTIAIGTITQKMFQSTKTSKEDTEGFIDYPRSIKTVKLAALIEERPDKTVKCSLRAKEEKTRVDLLAKEFNGGGHACAAGFSSQDPIDKFYPKFIKIAKKHLANVTKHS